MKHLGELLVEAGVITPEQLQQTLARPGDHRIGSRLLQLGVAHERALAEALARQGHPAIVLSESRLDLEALASVPRAIAHRYVLLPVAVREDALVVATPDPDDSVLSQVAFASGRRIEPVLALQVTLEQTIARAYDAAERGERVLAGKAARADGDPLSLVRHAEPPLVFGTLVDPATSPTPRAARPAVDQWSMPPTDAGLPPLVAVIEDDAAIRQLIRRALERDDVRVVEAATGTEGMQLLRGERPRVILLDAMLPGVHGFEICKQLKQSPRYREVPVVMISAQYTGWQNARDIYEQYGADEFVEKPFNVHLLRKKVATLLGRAMARSSPDPQIAMRIDELIVSVDGHQLAGRTDELAECIERWLALDPFDGRAWLASGQAAQARGDLDDARRALETAVTLLPMSFAAWSAVAGTYDAMGFTAKARTAWAEALDLAPDPGTATQIEHRLAR